MEFKIYFSKNPDFDPKSVTLETIKQTHLFLKEIEAECLGDAFYKMQAFNWSPNGEAVSLIKEKGLKHTSMSIGDVLENEKGDIFVVDYTGYTKLGNVWKDLNTENLLEYINPKISFTDEN